MRHGLLCAIGIPRDDTALDLHERQLVVQCDQRTR
jgi:hypothetical protein